MIRSLAPWGHLLTHPTRLLKTLLLVAVAMSVFKGVRLALLLSDPVQFADLGWGDTIMAFVAGLRFDLSIFLTFAAIPLWLLNFPLLSSRMARLVLGWSVFTLLVAASLLLIGDLLYFGEVQRHLTNELTLLANDTHFLVQMALGSYLGLFLGLMLFLILLGWLWHRILNLPEQPTRYNWWLFLLLLALMFIGIRQTTEGKPLGTIDAFSNGSRAYGNLVLNGPFTAYWSWYEGGTKHRENAMSTQEALEVWGLPSADYPFEQQYPDHPSGLNIVFVLLESWGSRFVDSFDGPNLGVTPNFDRLAAEGLKFPHFRASGQRSIQGIQASLTGIPYVPGTKNLGFGLEMSNFTHIGTLAQQHGYETIFVQASPRRSFHIDGVAAATGFAEYYGKEDIPLLLDYPDPSAAEFGWDYDTLMFLKKRLDRAQHPFIAYLFTGTTHTPYADPGPQWHPYPHEPQGEGGLFNNLSYSDWSIGEFMKAASQSPWFDNTVFIFTADHDLLHYVRTPLPFVDWFHIPLVIYAPHHIQPGVDERLAAQQDFLPTFMDLLGFGDRFAAAGRSLLQPPSGDEAVWFSDGGSWLGLITPEGYVAAIEDKLMASGSAKGPLSPQGAATLQHRMDAGAQIIRDALERNRWSH